MTAKGKPVDEPTEFDLSGRFLVDPYLNWANGEGIPVHLDFGHDLLDRRVR